MSVVLRKLHSFIILTQILLSLGTPRCLVIKKCSCMEGDCGKVVSVVAFIMDTIFTW
jgi:hypothetical protein